jgi:hypothetical protein
MFQNNFVLVFPYCYKDMIERNIIARYFSHGRRLQLYLSVLIQGYSKVFCHKRRLSKIPPRERTFLAFLERETCNIPTTILRCKYFNSLSSTMWRFCCIHTSMKLFDPILWSVWYVTRVLRKRVLIWKTFGHLPFWIISRVSRGTRFHIFWAHAFSHIFHATQKLPFINARIGDWSFTIQWRVTKHSQRLGHLQLRGQVNFVSLAERENIVYLEMSKKSIQLFMSYHVCLWKNPSEFCPGRFIFST